MSMGGMTCVGGGEGRKVYERGVVSMGGGYDM